MTRTPCNYKDCFVSVCDNGTFDMRGINYGKACPVRGAIWVDVKSTDNSDINLYVQKENERKEKIRLERERIAKEKRKAEEAKQDINRLTLRVNLRLLGLFVNLFDKARLIFGYCFFY